MSRWGPALLAQALAWLGALWLAPRLELPLAEQLTVTLLATVGAPLLSLLLREPRWRAPMHGVFCLAVGMASQAQWPAWIWGVALGLSLLVFGGGLTGQRAPLYLTQERALAAILACLPDHVEGRCLDIGAGVGSFILRIAPMRPRLQFQGIERSPLVCLLADLRCRLAGAGRVRFGDLWHSSLADYQVVYAFLSPEAMPDLWHKASAEMGAGSWLVVNAFPVPGVTASHSERYGEGSSQCVYCYRLPGPVAGRGAEPGPRGSVRGGRGDRAGGGASKRSSAPR